MESPPKAENVKHHYAAVLLVTESGKVIGQRRDNKPTIDNPGKVGTFGGSVEPDEDPLAAAWRELTQEETNLVMKKEKLEVFCEDVARRALTNEWEARHFYSAKITDDELANVEVYEGQGWAIIEGPDDPELIDSWRPVVRKLVDVLQS